MRDLNCHQQTKIAININGNLETVNGNLGPVNGNLGALKKQQFAVIIGKLLFLGKNSNALFSIKCLMTIMLHSQKSRCYGAMLGKTDDLKTIGPVR